MDEGKMSELIDSIRHNGILSPLLVSPAQVSAWVEMQASLGRDQADRYAAGYQFEIIDGHRRYIASSAANLEALPVRVFENAEEARYSIMVDSNLMRESVTPAEEALQYMELSERHGWSLSDLIKKFHKSEAYINERVRMIQDFPDVTKAVANRQINWSQAKQIMREKSESNRAYMIDQAVTHGASARTLGYFVDQFKSQEQIAAGQPAVHTPEHAAAFVPAQEPECIWCGRRDDQTNMVNVNCHSYHARDLRDYLDAAGINSVRRARQTA
jgi:ParB family transcriptional regulator, chromosome partitioning protein